MSANTAGEAPLCRHHHHASTSPNRSMAEADAEANTSKPVTAEITSNERAVCVPKQWKQIRAITPNSPKVVGCTKLPVIRSPGSRYKACPE